MKLGLFLRRLQNIYCHWLKPVVEYSKVTVLMSYTGVECLPCLCNLLNVMTSDFSASNFKAAIIY